MTKDKKVYHIEVDLPEDVLSQFIIDHGNLMLELIKNKVPIDRFNSIWTVHNQITMAKSMVEGRGYDGKSNSE